MSAAHYNQMRTRSDVVWITTPSGEVLLTDCPIWQAKHTRDLAAKAEAERDKFNHRKAYPVQEAAE